MPEAVRVLNRKQAKGKICKFVYEVKGLSDSLMRLYFRAGHFLLNVFCESNELRGHSGYLG